MTHTLGSWHTASTGNHQGLVIDDATGANIAVTYDKAHAQLVAAAPDLLAALEIAAHFIENGGDTEAFFRCREAWRNAFAKAAP